MYVKEKYIYSLRWRDGKKANSVTQSPPSGSILSWTPWGNAKGQDWGLVWVGGACFFFFSFSASPHFFMEKALVTHSSTLAWKIPWTEEPGRLQSTGSLRVGHDWATSLSVFTFVRWRRKWQPTPVFLPGESQGRGSLVGCRLWGCTESDTTDAT